MEYNPVSCLSFPESDFKVEASKTATRGPDSPSEECARSDTPSSDASTSGVCSMASSDFETCPEEKPFEQEGEVVIKYLNRDILDLCSNLHPYALYQSTSVPKMNMTNYWESRSIYHRLGPYGRIDEFDHETCCDCGFRTTVPKRRPASQFDMWARAT